MDQMLALQKLYSRGGSSDPEEYTVDNYYQKNDSINHSAFFKWSEKFSNKNHVIGKGVVGEEKLKNNKVKENLKQVFAKEFKELKNKEDLTGEEFLNFFKSYGEFLKRSRDSTVMKF